VFDCRRRSLPAAPLQLQQVEWLSELPICCDAAFYYSCGRIFFAATVTSIVNVNCGYITLINVLKEYLQKKGLRFRKITSSAD
jgi:hypothetical protein